MGELGKNGCADPVAVWGLIYVGQRPLLDRVQILKERGSFQGIMYRPL